MKKLTLVILLTACGSSGGGSSGQSSIEDDTNTPISEIAVTLPEGKSEEQKKSTAWVHTHRDISTFNFQDWPLQDIKPAVTVKVMRLGPYDCESTFWSYYYAERDESNTVKYSVDAVVFDFGSVKISMGEFRPENTAQGKFLWSNIEQDFARPWCVKIIQVPESCKLARPVDANGYFHHYELKTQVYIEMPETAMKCD